MADIRIFAIFVGLMLMNFASCMYDGNSDVVELTAANFQSKVVDSDSLWIVEFYAPWCGHCQSFAPEYAKAAKALKGVVKVGGVDMDKHQSVGAPYSVRGFPTVKVFGANKSKPTDYNGARTAQGIVNTALEELKKVVNARLTGKADSGSGSGKSGGGGTPKGDQKDVIELTDGDFEDIVMNSDDMWLVEFFAPWCGHCKNLAPEWASAATQLKGKVKVAAVDATVNTVIANRYGVRGYPTIKMFPAGKKDGEVVDYDGGRTASSIVEWATSKLSENVAPPEIKQLVDEASLKDACEQHPICVIAFLPNILDCQSKCRNNYIEILRKLGDKYKKTMWGYVWAESGAQLELEEALGIGGFGYPAMAALNVKKMKYAVLKGPFSHDGINEFLRELSVGRGSTVPMKGAELPKVHKTEPWDGKDGQPPKMDDIDLDDVFKDEL